MQGGRDAETGAEFFIADLGQGGILEIHPWSWGHVGVRGRLVQGPGFTDGRRFETGPGPGMRFHGIVRFGFEGRVTAELRDFGFPDGLGDNRFPDAFQHRALAGIEAWAASEEGQAARAKADVAHARGMLSDISGREAEARRHLEALQGSRGNWEGKLAEAEARLTGLGGEAPRAPGR